MSASFLDATDAYESLDARGDADLPQPALDPAQTPLPPSPPPSRHPSRPAIPSEFKPEHRPPNGHASSHPSRSSCSLPRKPSHRILNAPAIQVELPPAASSSGVSQLAVPRVRRKSEPAVKARIVALHAPAPNNASTPVQATVPVNTLSNGGPPQYLNGRKRYVAREHIFAKQVN